MSGCYQECKHYCCCHGEMYCSHPFWNGKGSYDSYIITQTNSRDGNRPPECPLDKSVLQKVIGKFL